jgi:hypothetical protein
VETNVSAGQPGAPGRAAAPAALESGQGEVKAEVSIR